MKALQVPSEFSVKTHRLAQSSRELVCIDCCKAKDQLVVEMLLVLLNRVPSLDMVMVKHSKRTAQEVKNILLFKNEEN